MLCFIKALLTSYPAPGRPRLDHVLANHQSPEGCTQPAMAAVHFLSLPSLFFFFHFFIFFSSSFCVFPPLC